MRVRYATRLDLIDWLIHSIAKSVLLEEVLRRFLDFRRRAIFSYWRLFGWMLAILGHTRSDAIGRILEASGYDINDVMLFSDSYLRFPQLMEMANELAALPGYKGAVTVIVRDKKDEAELKKLAGDARFMNMQQFWLDSSYDVANHQIVREVFAHLRALRDRQPAGQDDRDDARRVDMLETVVMDLHTQLVQAMRMVCALREARNQGGKIFVIAVDGDTRFYSMCYEALMRGAVRPIVALSQHSIGWLQEFDTTNLAFDLIGSLNRANEHLENYRDDDGIAPVLDESATVRKVHIVPGAIAVVSDAMPGSIYWQPLVNLAEEAHRQVLDLQVMVGSARAARRLRRLCPTLRVAAPSVNRTPGSDFVRSFKRLLALLEQSQRGDRSQLSEQAQLMLDYSLARLTLPLSIDTLGYRSYRATHDSMRWLRAVAARAVVVMPHWSRQGWAAVSAAGVLGVPSSSSPVVTVSSSPASIVEWQQLAKIGCYGTQCVTAFEDLGYSRHQLALVGNVGLDHTATLIERANAARAADDKLSRTILFATSGVNKNEADILSAIVTLCGEPRNRARLVIRPHPSIGRNHYRDLLGRVHSTVALVATANSVHEAIAAADVVITDFSTVGAEAVLLGRPLLVVNTTGAPFPANNYAALGVAMQADRTEDVAQMLKLLLDKGWYWPGAAAARERFTQAYNWKGDGKASQRLLSEVVGAGDRVPGVEDCLLFAPQLK